MLFYHKSLRFFFVSSTFVLTHDIFLFTKTGISFNGNPTTSRWIGRFHSSLRMGRPGKKKIMKIQLDSHYHLFIFFFKPSKVTIWHTFLECYTQKFFYKNANKLCRQQTIFLQERISSQVASSDESSLGNIKSPKSWRLLETTFLPSSAFCLFSYLVQRSY